MLRILLIPVTIAVALHAGITLAKDADIFRNPTVGFEVTKPADWHYATAEQHKENLKILDLSDSQTKAELEKYATLPLVAMTKHPEPYADINPSFKVNVKPYGPFKGMSPTALLGEIIPSMKRVFLDMDIVQAPTTAEVSGIKSGYARINYTMKVEGAGDFRITSEIWIVPRGEYFFVIGVGTREDEKTGSRNEMKAILDSVKISYDKAAGPS